jgi:hypothetical protein
MIFDDVQAAEKFYKEYAHDAGFSIRIGQQRIDDSGVLKWKRFLCARAGYKTSLGTNSNDSSKEVAEPGRHVVDVKLIFMLNALVKGSMKLQL